MKTFELLLYFNIVSFLVFGITCLFSERMVMEFDRFKLTNNQRVVTGILQLIAVAGLITSIWNDMIGFIASIGLALQMAAGFLVRLKIRDGIYRSSPALIFFFLNIILAYRFYLRMEF